MWNNVLTKLKGVVRNMFKTHSLEKTFDVQIATSDEMAQAIELWHRMYVGSAPWLDYEKTHSLGIPHALASELARLATVELESTISNNDYLQEQYQMLLSKLRLHTEQAVATGGIVFKPYVDGDKIVIDIVQAENFFPTTYNSQKQITGAVFLEEKREGDYIYTRVEHHQLLETNYTIQNAAFRRKSLGTSFERTAGTLGERVPMTSIDEWKDLSEEPWTIQNVTKPLFSYMRMPYGNTVDTTSPLGMALFGKAELIQMIKQADKQYSRILWEYQGSELAIDIDRNAIRTDKQTGKPILPEGQDRLFRRLDLQNGDEKDFYSVFNPAIRDSSLFTGLNELLKRIEFNVGMSYGTISDPSEMPKTATEIISSKQRLYTTVKELQQALEFALDDLVYAMAVWGQLYKLCNGNYETTYKWDDSIIVDREKELASMQADVAAGLLRPEKYLAKKYGVSEADALKLMPQSQAVAGDPFDPKE